MTNLIGSMEAPYIYRKTWEYQDMVGHYLGEYSFFDDEIGTEPVNWVVQKTGTCTALVIAEHKGHKKVVELTDTTNSDTVAIYNLFTAQSTGAIEFYYETENPNRYTQIILYSALLQPVISLVFALGWVYGNYAFALPAAQLYHFKLDFDGSAVGVTIDDLFKANANYSFPGPIIAIWIGTWTQINTTPRHWVDAIDYSWSDGYYLGRNKDLKQQKVDIYESEYLKQLEGILK